MPPVQFPSDISETAILLELLLWLQFKSIPTQKVILNLGAHILSRINTKPVLLNL